MERKHLKHQKSFPLPLKQCDYMPLFNITPIQTTLVGGREGCYHCSSSFHDWSKIIQCLKNSHCLFGRDCSSIVVPRVIMNCIKRGKSMCSNPTRNCLCSIRACCSVLSSLLITNKLY